MKKKTKTKHYIFTSNTDSEVKMSELCRVCLEVAELEAALISDCLPDLNKPIYSILNLLGDLDEDTIIASDDGFPQNICSSCYSKVKLACEFVLADASFGTCESASGSNYSDYSDSDSGDFSQRDSTQVSVEIKFEPDDVEDENSGNQETISVMTKAKSLKEMSKINMASQKARGGRSYCEICNHTYSSTQELRRHRDRIHATHKPYKCDVKNCHRTFSKEYLIRKHKRESHHAALNVVRKSFILMGKPEHVTCCCMCEFEITTQEELEQHVKEAHPNPEPKKHPGECGFECQYCLRRFQKKGSFYLHFADKEYDEDVVRRKQIRVRCRVPCVCHTCGKTFPSRNNLYIHEQRVHPIETPFKCHVEGCKAKYSLKSALAYHLKENHQTEKKFVCHICAAAFTRNKYLNSHLVVHQKGKDIKCSQCRLYFKSEADMEKHVKRHEKKFTKTNKQSEKVTERNYKCTRCERTFLREGHLHLHEKACKKGGLDSTKMPVSSSVKITEPVMEPVKMEVANTNADNHMFQ